MLSSIAQHKKLTTKGLATRLLKKGVEQRPSVNWTSSFYLLYFKWLTFVKIKRFKSLSIEFNRQKSFQRFTKCRAFKWKSFIAVICRIDSSYHLDGFVQSLLRSFISFVSLSLENFEFLSCLFFPFVDSPPPHSSPRYCFVRLIERFRRFIATFSRCLFRQTCERCVYVLAGLSSAEGEIYRCFSSIFI